MKFTTLTLSLFWLLSTFANCQTVQVDVGFSEKLGPMQMERMALGQGGLSEEPMLAGRLTEIRALNPGIIRLFVSEYYDLLPKTGTYHFQTLDSMVNSVLLTGAKPLMSLCFKPKVLFPKIDQDIVEPTDYKQWEELVFEIVKHLVAIEMLEVGYFNPVIIKEAADSNPVPELPCDLEIHIIGH